MSLTIRDDEIGELLEVVTTNSGYLKCSFDRTYWCKHVEAVVTCSYDSEELWDEGFAVADLHLNAMVPIVPSKNLWLDADLLYRRIGDTITAKVMARPEDSKGEYDIDLGYIHPGEGRVSIRLAAIQWFYANVPVNSLACEASSHGFRQSLKLAEDLKDPAAALPQMWTMWRSRTCLMCTYSPSDADVPDDVGGKAVRFS